MIWDFEIIHKFESNKSFSVIPELFMFEYQSITVTTEAYLLWIFALILEIYIHQLPAEGNIPKKPFTYTKFSESNRQRIILIIVAEYHYRMELKHAKSVGLFLINCYSSICLCVNGSWPTRISGITTILHLWLL